MKASMEAATKVTFTEAFVEVNCFHGSFRGITIAPTEAFMDVNLLLPKLPDWSKFASTKDFTKPFTEPSLNP